MPAAKDIPSQAVFITGTDTGVGKTIVTAALAKHLSAKGLKVGIMKPVETGISDTCQLGSDGKILRWAANAKDSAELISPYRFNLPASPHQAARAEKEIIEPENILDSFLKIRRGKDIVLVEGAGGLMVPLRGGYLMADLIKDMNIPALIISHPRLGTINHTLLTTLAARTMEITLCGMIINNMPADPGQIETEAPHLLASLASTDLLGVLPEVTGTDEDKVNSLSEIISSLPTYSWLLSALNLPA